MPNHRKLHQRGANSIANSEDSDWTAPLGFTSQKVLVIPRKRWLHPDMTEKLLTGT